jgi:GTP-binding protein LepA
MVFCGVFPINAHDFPELRDALDKLSLNDSSFSYEAESSPALGFGFRCGFLGSLHMEITQERLEREFNLSLISTAPSVRYQLKYITGEEVEIDNPSKFPPVQKIEHISEPRVLATIHIPAEFIGAVLDLCETRRGVQKDLQLHGTKTIIRYDLPLAEIVFDFHDRLKSSTKGYASMDYEMFGYAVSDLVKLDILVNNEAVDALSVITHRERAYRQGKELVEKLREVIPRQMFEVALQAAIGSRVIARETVRAMSKNVLAKCYGGDISRKRKLLEKQKEGKRRMKRVGSVDIPQEAFLAILKVGE